MKFIELDHSFINRLVPLALELNPSLSPELLTQRFNKMFLYPTYTCFGLVEDDETLVAMAGTWTSTRLYSGKQLELDNVVVHPDHRSRGLGAKLQSKIEYWCSDKGYESIELNTYVGNRPSHRFYLRQGYDIYGFHCIKKLNTALNPHSQY